MKRSLTLNREALAELSADELVDVGGGQAEYSGNALTCPLVGCVLGFTMPPTCYSAPWC